MLKATKDTMVTADPNLERITTICQSAMKILAPLPSMTRGSTIQSAVNEFFYKEHPSILCIVLNYSIPNKY